MTAARNVVAYALFVMAGSSCGTTLIVDEISRNKLNPSGVVINHPTRYKGKATVFQKEQKLSLTGIDHNSALEVNIRRLPFGDGELVLELDKNQMAEKVSITSAAGAADSAAAVEAIVDARAAIVDDEDE